MEVKYQHILLFVALFIVILVFSNTIFKKIDECYETSMKKMDTLVTVVRDTTFVHDTIYKEVKRTQYINAVSYSNAFGGRLDTLETHKGTTAITVQFADGNFEVDEVEEYAILCNGKMYDVPYDEDDPDSDTFNECAGEWIIKIKGKR